MLPAAHGAGRAAGRRAPGRRPRRRGAGAAAARGRRGVPPGGGGGAGVNAADAPVLRQPQRLRHRGAAGGDVRRGLPAAGAGVVDGGLRAGPLRLPGARAGRPAAAHAAPISTPACSSTAARSAASSCGGGWSARTRRCGRAACTRRARPPRSTTRWRGLRRRAARVVALRYHNVYGPGMPRDTPYSGVAAIFRSALESRRAAKGFRRRRPDARLRPRRRRRRGERGGGRARAWTGSTAFNVCSGRPISILRGRHRAVRGPQRGPAPVVTGQYRSGDVRHIVADPAKAARRAGFPGRRSIRRDGLREFAHRAVAGCRNTVDTREVILSR